MILGCLFVAAHGSVVAGQRIAANELAQLHYDRGRELYADGDYAGALAAFQESYRFVPSPNSHLYVARCLRDLGDTVLAVRAYEHTLRRARERATAEPRFAPTRDAAAEELTPLLPLVGRLVVRGDPPDDGALSIGGESVPIEMLGLPRVVAPGEVAVVVTRGSEVRRRRVRVLAGEEVTVDIEWPAPSQPVVPVSPVTPPAEIRVEPATSWMPWLVTGGLASVAALGLFAGFAAAAQARFDDLDETCGGRPCPPSELGALEEGETFQTVANVSLAVGIAGGVAALVFLVLELVSDG